MSRLQTMVDLAALVDPLIWEQANESALHKKLFCVDNEMALLTELSARRTVGTPLIRQVLSLRPPGVLSRHANS